MSEDIVTEIRRIYEETLERKKNVDEDVKMLAYFVGKLNSLINTLKLMEKMGEEIKEDLTKLAIQSLEAKRVFLSELPERKPEDYERFSKEAERINERLKAQKEAIDMLINAFKSRVEEEAERVREKIMEKRKEKSL
jgi:gas vesicle protein